MPFSASQAAAADGSSAAKRSNAAAVMRALLQGLPGSPDQHTLPSYTLPSSMSFNLQKILKT